MLRPALLILVMCFLPLAARADMEVARNGVAHATVFVNAGASSAERHAASELVKALSQITEASFSYSVGTVLPRGNVILVGQGDLSSNLFPRVPWRKLREEQTVTESLPNVLLLAGGRPRGTLYCVYRLLQKLGVRWWTPWATDLPKIRNLTLSTGTSYEEPALEYRDPSFFSEFNKDWAAHNYANDGPSRPELGGGVVYEGFVHTYYPLVPPATYFKSHPEWYSLINGKRTADNAQLCTTNPQLRAFVLQRVKELLRANGSAKIISVSQNDCFNPCQCDVCQALAKEQGSQSAPVIALANYVAEGINNEFPNVAVDTLAYQWSRHAPKSLKPLPNVIVRLCSIECDFGTLLDSPKNKDFAQDVLDWSRLTNRLYVWDYVTNFANYMLPMPDDSVLGPNLRFLADHGVKGVFEEGDYTSNGGAMSELKAWVLSQLLWNPHSDEGHLRREFLAGYFGSAAPNIARYLKLMDDAGAATQCTIYQDANAPYLTPELIFESERLWMQAEHSVIKDPEKLWRVLEAHLALQYVFLKRWDELAKYATDHKMVWPLSSKQAYGASWLAVATGPGPKGWTPITAVNENGLTPEAFIKATVH